jgi:hypothetical protein
MDLGPSWPGHLALILTLGCIALLCRAAWRSAAPEFVERRIGVFAWWLFAVLPWLLLWLYERAAASGAALPALYSEYTPEEFGAQVVFVLKQMAIGSWLLGGALAAVLATGRAAWQRRRGGRPAQTDGV